MIDPFLILMALSLAFAFGFAFGYIVGLLVPRNLEKEDESNG